MRLTLQGADTFSDLPARATLRRWITRALGDASAELTVRFVGTAEGRRLNRQFRQRDYATNVLTFGYAGPAQNSRTVYADIVLCVPVLRREAREQGKPWRHHLAHLLIHGSLHAVGLDHRRASDRRHMEAREKALLAALRIPDPYATR